MLPKSSARAAPLRAGVTLFVTAEEAWLWTMAALVARREGAPLTSLRNTVPTPAMGITPPTRPCEPDDVVKCLDRLYRQRRIELAHARILRIWGERQEPPDPHYDHGDHRLWKEALDRLEWPLREKGLLAPSALSDIRRLEAVL
jgi:hypothetical protein